MKKLSHSFILTIFLFIVLSCKENSNHITENIISIGSNKIVTIVKDNSIYSDSLNWKSIDLEIKQLLKGTDSTKYCSIVANLLIKKLRIVGDNHSLYLTKDKSNKMASGNIAKGQPLAKHLENNIGYISIPSFGSVNEMSQKKFSEDVQNLIKSLDEKYLIKNWIVDLREDMGGNMYPMIAGLGPILGDGTLGYFISRDGQSSSWSYAISDPVRHIMPFVHVDSPYELKNKEIKIAVLIGPHTASSGEMTTISFIGKKNCKLFGEPSGGYTTANKGFILPDSSYIYLASSFVADRNNKGYHSKIQPDFLIEKSKNTRVDNCIDAAKKWLISK